MKHAFKRLHMARRACSLAAMLALCSQSAWAVMPTSYSGTLLEISGFAVLNNQGQVAGMAIDPATGLKRLAITGANGMGVSYVSDASLGATDWNVQGLNDSGVIVGSYVGPAADKNGALTTRGFFTGANATGVEALTQTWATQGYSSTVVDVNARGQMVAMDSMTENGTAYLSNDHGQTWTALNLGPDARVTSINDAGQLAGNIDGPADRWPIYQAMVTGPNGTNPQGLGTLGYNSFSGSWTSRANDINNLGQVTGDTNWSGNDYRRAFIAEANGQGLTNLGNLNASTVGVESAWPEAIDMVGLGLNDLGQVVGRANTRQFGLGTAFVTDTGGTGLYDLSKLLNFQLPQYHTLTGALAINESGQILASVQNFGQKKLYLLTPSTLAAIPEASTVAYMALGLVGIALASRRKQ
jgi:hypothetical protein